jgi:catalase
MTEKKKLTTNAGAPVVDNQNIMTTGPRGPGANREEIG